MYVIMGGTGHVGSATAAAPLARGEQVAIVTHDANRAGAWLREGAEIVEANVNEVASLRAAFRRGRHRSSAGTGLPAARHGAGDSE